MSFIRVVYAAVGSALVAGFLWLPLTYLLGASPKWWLVVVGVIAVGFIAIWYWYERWGEERALRQKIHNREQWERMSRSSWNFTTAVLVLMVRR